MLIFVADDEPFSLEDLRDCVQRAEPGVEIKAFDHAQPLLNELKCERQKPDVCFLDIVMPEMNGIELAKVIKNISPNTRIVFVTGFAQYAVEAFSIHADGYIMKPVTCERIREEFKHLRPMLQKRLPKRIRAKCFGNFEVYLDDKPMMFHYNKTRELLAYLISRNGALCSNGEIMAALWEDESGEERKKDYFKKLRLDLRDQLSKRGLGDILVQQRGMLGIDAEEIDCDYYEWMNGNEKIINTHVGGFISQYSWGEVITGEITTSLKKP